jgi:DNA (cytosine-5)-methyltransferase 1
LAVIGGPPCQGFSTAGLRSANDPRNRLIFNYFAVVDALRPRWFLFENVEGLLTSGDGEAVISLVRLFIERGYSVRLEKVNFASFGLPQARKRVVLIGNRLGMDFRFPTPSHAFNAGKHQSRSQLPQGPTLLAALAGLGPARTGQRCRSSYASALPASPYDDLMRRDRSDFSLHYWSASALDKRRYPHLKPGQTMKDLPPELWHSSF